ncbi:hypothetical protein AB0953_13595 [Streptomyces sp. NPDC046866]|uniref:hypothetical protein n=1 Tax=Streptomyces sp. NPDC046866 TaxID=3154921 RepID=UPI00345524BF
MASDAFHAVRSLSASTTLAASGAPVIQGSKVLAGFRAGSGTTTDECQSGRGWLPNGTYTVGQHYEKYDGELIKGYAIRLSDKKCNNGTGRERDQLFIRRAPWRRAAEPAVLPSCRAGERRGAYRVSQVRRRSSQWRTVDVATRSSTLWARRASPGP